MSDCKAVATPGEVNLKLVKSNDEEQKLVDPKLYKSLVGSLLFIGRQTRPDILHIVNQLSRFLDKPNESHWKAAKQVLRYLKRTIDLRLAFLHPVFTVLSFLFSNPFPTFLSIWNNIYLHLMIF